ncbi:MAG: ADP-ribosylglycohydrolase family protein, partial [Acidobacteria bacterium]|nr:ADP-ribosylglycohydrolase family protein [Acidobacteriota bacterium]
MKRVLLCCLLPGLIAAMVLPPAGPGKRTIAKEALLDKIKGGWAGQIFGVVYGAPTEFRAGGATYDAERVGTPAELKGALNQDDLYVEMTLAEVMDRYGLDATAQEYGEAFRDSKYALWHANLAGRRNLSRGIMPPQSGHPRYNAHANDIDFQIEADFIGLMAPGLPRAVQLYGDRIGHVMNYGDGVYGGIFIGAMYSAAFFETDPRKVVEAGLGAIPAQSGYAAVIRDLLAWHQEEPRDWRAAWKRLEDKWDRDDPCPEGALTPFNIDARLNGAFVALGLLYGEKDFDKTIEIAARAGQDSDCNPASAGGILGVMLGYQALPSRWVEALLPIA